ncbi:MAG TPA: sterol desaturase family protein [Kofleriaceae bacterium]|nr:sterol desaturase family protein [Kofleriaceae bacterium]
MILLSILLSILLGAFTWSFLEYVIHRWLGHDRRFRGNPFGKEHLRHHVEGDYFAASWKKAIFAVVVSTIMGVPAVLLAGVYGAAWVAGFVAFYAAYEVLHRREHTHAGIGPYGRWARRHHFHHHFVDGRANHGVTSPLWDLAFGTYRQPAVIPVPQRLCMAWLLDPHTREVRSEHAARYTLRTTARA